MIAPISGYYCSDVISCYLSEWTAYLLQTMFFTCDDECKLTLSIIEHCSIGIVLKFAECNMHCGHLFCGVVQTVMGIYFTTYFLLAPNVSTALRIFDNNHSVEIYLLTELLQLNLLQNHIFSVLSANLWSHSPTKLDSPLRNPWNVLSAMSEFDSSAITRWQHLYYVLFM